MTKTLRKDRVLVDWSQNDRHKTTVNVYSPRAKDRPTVSTPVTWDEVRGLPGGGRPDAAGLRHRAGARARAGPGRPVRRGADAHPGASRTSLKAAADPRHDPDAVRDGARPRRAIRSIVTSEGVRAGRGRRRIGRPTRRSSPAGPRATTHRVVTLERRTGWRARATGLAVAGARSSHRTTPTMCSCRRGSPQVAALDADAGTAWCAAGPSSSTPGPAHVHARAHSRRGHRARVAIREPLIHGSSMFARTSSPRWVGGEMGGSSDYDLFLRLAALGRPLAMPVVWLRCRRHTDQLTARDGAHQRAQSIANTVGCCPRRWAARSIVPRPTRPRTSGARPAPSAIWLRPTPCSASACASPHTGEPASEARCNDHGGALGRPGLTARPRRPSPRGGALPALRRWPQALGAADLTLRRVGRMGAVRFRELT